MRSEITREWKEVIGNAEVKVFFNDTTGNMELEDKNGETIDCFYDNGDYEALEISVKEAIAFA